jgi:hypothetical protein
VETITAAALLRAPGDVPDGPGPKDSVDWSVAE